MPVGVLDKVDAAVQLVEDEAQRPVLGFQGVKVLGAEGEVGGVVAEVIRLGAVRFPAQLQLEVGGAVPQEEELPATVGHVQGADGREAQGVPVEGGAPVQVQHMDAGVVDGGHRNLPPVFLFASILAQLRGRNNGRIFANLSKPSRQIRENGV